MEKNNSIVIHKAKNGFILEENTKYRADVSGVAESEKFVFNKTDDMYKFISEHFGVLQYADVTELLKKSFVLDSGEETK